MKNKRKFNYRHILCLVITLGFLACTVFLFPKSIIRIIESFRDFGLSFAYYYLELFEINTTLLKQIRTAPLVVCKSINITATFYPENCAR